MEILKSINSLAHIISSSLALIIGAMVLFQTKGTPKHKRLGAFYFWLMVVANVTCLFIMKAFGKWFFPHWLGIAALVVLIPGYLFGKYQWGKHWLKFHIIGIVLSYYLLVGGAINEAFLHIPPLRPHIIGGGGPVIGMVHMVAQLAFIVLLVFFLRKYRSWKNKPT